MYNVYDMYSYAKTHNTKLLSDFGADFWQDYKDNYIKYDKLFARYFHSFHYFLQDEDDAIANVTAFFIEDVYNHLLINSKKYSELYRVNVVDDELYSLYNNYDMTETMDKDTSTDIGQQTSSSAQDLGTRDSNRSVAPYDTDVVHLESVDSVSAQHNTASATNGARLDTGTEDYTLTRKGNIGIQTVSDMLDKHIKVWTKWEFYRYIFSEINNELLLV